jgi:hypothetical protein
MPKCDHCAATILFGGVSEGPRRFCNKKCAQAGRWLALSDAVPPDIVDERTLDLHGGPCPRCGGPGPIDVHTSHRVWSAVYLTSCQSRPQVCCRSCAIKCHLGSTAFCLCLGWWGFPFGLVITPVQILRNVIAICSGGPDPALPSIELEKAVRLQIAVELDRQRYEAPPTVPTG